MKQRIFSVYDVKAAAYLPPFFLPEEGMALRTFANCARDVDHAFGRNPEDYTLFWLGFFDHETGRFELEKSPRPLARAHELAARAASVPDVSAAVQRVVGV